MLPGWRQNTERRQAVGVTRYSQGCPHCSVYAPVLLQTEWCCVLFYVGGTEARKDGSAASWESNPLSSPSSALILTMAYHVLHECYEPCLDSVCM